MSAERPAPHGAYTPAALPDAVGVDAAFWRRRLEPGEHLLWIGRPRRGLYLWAVGGSELGQILLSLALIAVVAIVIASDVLGTDDLFLRLAAVALGLRMITLPMLRARRLMNSRYAVTDRRAIVVSGVIRPADSFTLPHDATAPRILPERWGETVYVGQRASGAPESWQKWIGWTGDRNQWRDNVIFYRLEPDESPLDLLKSLHRAGGVPMAFRNPSLYGTFT